MINWHDVTKEHLEKFEILIREKSTNRKLDEYIGGLESKALANLNILTDTCDNGIPEQQPQTWAWKLIKYGLRSVALF